jgi:hypothetical protein
VLLRPLATVPPTAPRAAPVAVASVKPRQVKSSGAMAV